MCEESLELLSLYTFFLDSRKEPIWMPIYVFILGTSLTIAIFVANLFPKRETWKNIEGYIQGKGHLYANNVAPVLSEGQKWPYITG